MESSARMAEVFQFDVFLSYSSKDKTVVHELATRLKKDGVRVWLDEEQIKPGDNILAKIEDGLERSRVLVLFMSGNAFGSDWTKLESYTYRFKDPLNKENRFLPVRLDDAEIKGSIAQFSYIDWHAPEGRETEYEKLLAGCLPPKTTLTAEEQQEREKFSERVISLGHTGAIWSVAWSGDGERALSGSADKTVRLWEVNSGKCLRVLEGHTDSIWSVAWSGDGKRALSGSADKTVRLWEVDSGKCLRVLEGHTDSVRSAAWSGDGKRALSGSDDNTVRLWEVDSGKCVRVLEGHSESVWSVVWSSDGKRALSGSSDETIRLWDVETGKCLRLLESHTGSVLSVAWSGDGKSALSGSTDNTIRLWDVETGKCVRVLEDHTDSVRSVAWSGDGKRALSGSADNTLRLWELDSGKCVRVLEGHTDSVRSVAWSGDGKRALTGSADNTLRLREVDSGKCVRVLEGHTDSVRNVAWSCDGKRALSGSDDNTVRLWEVDSGKCLRVLEGHTGSIWSMAWSGDSKRALSGSADKTVRLWEVDSGKCLRVLEGHTDSIWSVAWSGDGKRALSGSHDNTVRLWEVNSGKCLRLLEGHTAYVWSVAWSGDGKRALSGSDDKTVRLWEVDSGKCLRVLEGHTDSVWSAAWSGNGKRALSGSADNTVRLWEVDSGKCVRVLEGHTAPVTSVAWSGDGKRALSGSDDQTVRLWEVDSGKCLRVLEGHTAYVISAAWNGGKRAFSGAFNGVMRVWDVADSVPTEIPHSAVWKIAAASDGVQYTNAKVLLVGETRSGKTGMAERLAYDRPPAGSSSTSGTWSTQCLLKDLPPKAGWERELWLWDFGGQADQRLVHQLYLDHTALVLLMFDSEREIVLPGLREWQQALARSKASSAPTFLLAGRTDAGFRFDREKVKSFAQQSGYQYFETSALTAQGIPELRKGIIETILWDSLTPHNSPAIFKRLKDEILKLRDEGVALVTFKELEGLLRSRLSAEIKFQDAQLDTVVSLLDGPGVVKELDFGTYILLRPEWINIYAQAVIRTLRADQSGLGCLELKRIAEGNLIFQTTQADGKIVDEKRLERTEEQVVLQVMEQMLQDRRLCLRQGGELVFPSYFGRERASGPVPPKFFVSYTISGFLDDIYASLVVKLAHCGAFKLKELWRDAADFETEGDGKVVGVKLVRADDGRGELLAHHAKGVTQPEQVLFAGYIHKHLIEKSTQEVPRLRYYICPHCDHPVKDRELALELLEESGEDAEIMCQKCHKTVPLWDNMEKLFAGESLKNKIAALSQKETEVTDMRQVGQLLVHEVSARIKSANQNCNEIAGDEDSGVDMLVEFTDDEGNGTGKHMYLKLLAGNSHLKRGKDGTEVFTIEKQSWVKRWIGKWPMMLVIGTFPEKSERGLEREKKQFSDVRWMEVGALLKKLSKNGTERVGEIVFKGERVDAENVRRWRKTVLEAGKGS